MQLPPDPRPPSEPGRRQYVATELKRGMLLVRPVGPSIGQREAPIILEEVREIMRRAGREARMLVIDLSDVSFVSSMGLGMCIDLRNQATQQGARSVLLGLRPDVAQLFRMMRLERLYTIVKSADELERLAA
ncbi:MAG: STAS domain-containing protein [Phycisphaerales bacterium]|nr:STAS domain-containing protein [Phycisphaerales bacterium]